MSKIFYLVALMFLFGLPVSVKAESMEHMSGMSMPAKAIGCGCCEKMGMSEKGTASEKTEGMQCMGKGDDKPMCGCCEKMMGKKSVISHPVTSRQFNE